MSLRLNFCRSVPPEFLRSFMQTASWIKVAKSYIIEIYLYQFWYGLGSIDSIPLYASIQEFEPSSHYKLSSCPHQIVSSHYCKQHPGFQGQKVKVICINFDMLLVLTAKTQDPTKFSRERSDWQRWKLNLWKFASKSPPFSFVKVYLSHFRKNICHHPMWYFATVDETWINCLFLCNLSGTHFLCHLRNLCWGWGGRRGLHSLKLLEPPLP